MRRRVEEMEMTAIASRSGSMRRVIMLLGLALSFALVLGVTLAYPTP